jgi:hypothetical protein
VPNLPQEAIPHGTGRHSRVRAGNRGHGPSDATERWAMAGLVMVMSFRLDPRGLDEVPPWEGSWQRRGRNCYEGCPSAGAAALVERDGKGDWGSFGRMVSNRQAETPGGGQ